MTRTQLALRAGIASVALTALGLVAAAPAAAHTNNMYTFISFGTEVDDGFATIGKTDGVAMPLPTPTGIGYEIRGIEVASEKGVAIGYNENTAVFEWNHTTGEIGPAIAVYLPSEDYDFGGFSGLDTLNDGRTVTILEFDTEDASDQVWIATVNPGTSELIPVADISDVIVVDGIYVYEYDSLATDPATGITYVFIQNDASNEPFYLVVDVAAGTHGEPTLFQGDGFEDGEFRGADFDADGSLYFIYANNDSLIYELSKLGAPATWATAERQFISSAPAQYESIELGSLALTIEHTVLAATGSELPIAAFVILGTFAVLAGGVTVTVARRRSEAGTV